MNVHSMNDSKSLDERRGVQSLAIMGLLIHNLRHESRVAVRQQLALRAPLKSYKAEETESAFDQDAPPIWAAEISVETNGVDLA